MIRSWFWVAALLWSSPALADAVPAPPADCPPGSVGRTGHGGTHCAATTCQRDADCGDGMRCQPRALCVREVAATFNTYTQRPARATYQVAIRACPAGAAQCPPDSPAQIGFRSGGRGVTSSNGTQNLRVTGPAQCQTARRCVSASAPPAPTTAAPTPPPTPAPTTAAPTPPPTTAPAPAPTSATPATATPARTTPSTPAASSSPSASEPHSGCAAAPGRSGGLGLGALLLLLGAAAHRRRRPR